MIPPISVVCTFPWLSLLGYELLESKNHVLFIFVCQLLAQNRRKMLKKRKHKQRYRDEKRKAKSTQG